mmetsp:Transcript_18944/g.25667  ORF Transcript_18944/g.25667 Transcript_18944/m.25667 type:complete len:158 (+) Transcript_18944:44-517(+)|eukprot:CAMPEP_0185577208 /NCGR_PEP_ID=MMETSP0434-20130131/9248_1 /TAXON_ID=626734 ORGANISM="Favella taraikaensis, Strain Fe Narragansett Bay" /NCGR_SAMPLE_ID=MMETSP0434 /ASSEMBLY_ACC=CAM_ASM_000379 /LENGTH=157 /DNA_ID=CAMNT_0028194705 /DNA_START=24 /DNA_END=497 /DNA_ORIENTATION=+
MAEKPGKPAGRAGMTQVEINACWVEAVRKENKGRILNENFDFNPKNLIAITQKPTQVNPSAATAAQETAGDAEAELKVLQDKLESLKKAPKKKFNYPQTAAQELGWDMDTEFLAHAPKYGVNKACCPETQYANSYVTMTTRSPFAAPRANNVETAKK